MRKLFFITSAIILASISSYATSSYFQSEVGAVSQYVEPETKIEPVSYSVDLGDITDKGREEVEKALEGIFNDLIPDSEEKCSMRVTASVVSGNVTYKFTVKSTGTGRAIRTEAKDLTTILMKIVTSQEK